MVNYNEPAINGDRLAQEQLIIKNIYHLRFQPDFRINETLN